MGDYSMWAGYDYERSTNTAYQGGGSRWMLILNNDAAGSVDIYLEGDVLYFQDQGGESDVS